MRSRYTDRFTALIRKAEAQGLLEVATLMDEYQSFL